MESNISVNIDSFTSDECSICLEDIISSSMTILDCGHVLHTDCLLMYANHRIRNTSMNNSTNIACPVCRYPLLSENDVEISDNITEDTLELETTDTRTNLRRSHLRRSNNGHRIIIFLFCICFWIFIPVIVYGILHVAWIQIKDSDSI